MSQYGEIYDKVFSEHSGYQNPIGSPGFRLCLQNQQRLMNLGPHHLDYGSGAGFAVELMRSHLFRKESYGVDVSAKMAASANARIGAEVIHLLENGRAPFPNDTFDLVTCFDVLEHLDPPDIFATRDEIQRVLKPDFRTGNLRLGSKRAYTIGPFTCAMKSGQATTIRCLLFSYSRLA